MVEEIAPDLFRVEVPLPRNPLRSINSYVVKGSPRSLVVDTGMNRRECLDALRGALEDLGIDLDRTDFFITHLHADHVGLVSSLASKGSRVLMSGPDAERLASEDIWETMRAYASRAGFPEAELDLAIARHPGHRYTVKTLPRFDLVKEGDLVAAGNYLFMCVFTPGHTRGHVCLHERARKLLLSGDHVLRDITPNISLWSDEVDALDEYLRSLDVVGGMEVDLVLPGHRSAFTDLRVRVTELKRHHEARLTEVLRILEGGPKTPFEVASKMSWDLSFDSWEEFPPPQKWFATGEAVAHLRYLEERGLVSRTCESGLMFFSIAPGKPVSYHLVSGA